MARLDERVKERFHSFSNSLQRIEANVASQAGAVRNLESAIQHNDDKASAALQSSMVALTEKFEKSLRELTTNMSAEFIRKVQFSPIERIIYVLFGGLITFGISVLLKRWG